MLRFSLLVLAVVGCLATRAVVTASAAPPPEWNLPQSSEEASWASRVSGNHRCVPIPSTIEMCSGIGYTEMRLPNMLNHDSAKEVQDQAAHWMPLVKTNCHPEIRVLLCSIYAPVCIQRLLERSIKPCRTLCESVKSSCLAIMEKFGFDWPDMLNCMQFPPEHDLMCIKRPVTNTDVAAQSTQCQACVREPNYESLVSGYCMNEVVLKTRIGHVTPGPSATAGSGQPTSRHIRFKGRQRFFSAPPQLRLTDQPRPRRKRQRQRQRRQNLGGRRRNQLQLPGGGWLASCSPGASCHLLDEAAAHPKRRYLVMGSLRPNGTSIDVKFIAEWNKPRQTFRRALRSMRRDKRRRGGGNLCRGGASLLALNSEGGPAVTAATSADAAGGRGGGRRPRRNRRKGGGGGGRRKKKKKNRRRTDAAPAPPRAER